MTTPEEIRAARIEVQAFHFAGLEPDPALVKLANTTQPTHPPAASDYPQRWPDIAATWLATHVLHHHPGAGDITTGAIQ